MNVYQSVTYVTLGILLGLLGQGTRVIVGLKKASDEAALAQQSLKGIVDLKRLAVSLLIGGVAGGIGAISLLGNEIDKEFLLTLVAVGYSGADFIEGFLRTKTPI
ncbi:hypothetical protein NDI45_03135 [Leptolyngbya sp. GB1-A1]|uniref:hypothetical protein n=1 Tax=Leptolyngbya sp. GB1-A1 TaxID=2933908 RepID=UPI0032983E65